MTEIFREVRPAGAADAQRCSKIKSSVEVPATDAGLLAADVPGPTARQARLYVLHNLIPFIGFGFFDNAIMILAGDFIDARLGVVFGFSTMTAAALGNTFSDVIGLWCSGFIETAAAALGLPDHNLTNAQRRTLKVRILKNTSMVVGITIGCTLGMFPLVYPQDWRLYPSRQSLEEAFRRSDFDTSPV